ncbi:hypothetical protein HCN51_31685 [Nonomuraea sp. FMUSA5-5]|uniref:Uncharacterized protein n=1 Tax=Nonomuraea composti TaxID=2720023 RepID=A0ABX1BAS3_9ACTN|nr:hypothetical protein [Nonomuraea sp. FMUSA5-5]NJP93947.1 hypothetical protein [Nonomuraea sp. FMUSA5-5]
MTEEELTAWARARRDEQAAEALLLWERPAQGQPKVWLAESEVEALVCVGLALTVYSQEVDPDEPIAALVKQVEARLAERAGRARHRAAVSHAARRAGGLRR